MLQSEDQRRSAAVGGAAAVKAGFRGPLAFAGLVTASTIICTFLILLAVHRPLDVLVDGKFIFVTESAGQLTSVETLWIDNLMRDGKVITLGNLVSDLAAFYETIIVVLLAGLALVSTFSFLVIRGSSERHAEAVARERTQEIVSQKFREHEFHVKLMSDLDVKAKEYTSSIMDEIHEFKGSLEKILDDITQNENAVSELRAEVRQIQISNSRDHSSLEKSGVELE